MRSPSSALLICTMTFSTTSAQIPTLVKDINPTGDSNVANLFCSQNTLYFSANDGVHGAELWRSDGTEAGTFMLKDMNEGPGNGAPRWFTEMNGLLYFTATDGVNDVQLWRTDGTANGTQSVADLADVPGLEDWTQLVTLPGEALGEDLIYFVGRDDAAGNELWTTDGTPAGTRLFVDINPGPTQSSIQFLMVHDRRLFLRASDGTHGPEPWVSDGTVAGTHMIKNIIPGSPGSSPFYFTGVGDLVFFRAGTVATGDELWATDGTEAGTYMVQDIRPGPNTSLPYAFAAYNDLLFLRAYDQQGNDHLWHSDGTSEGTVILEQPANDYELAESLTVHDGLLYFTAHGDFTRQLWRTDGTAAGTEEILVPGSDVVQPMALTSPTMSCDGKLYYRAAYMSETGLELYVLSDGTNAINERSGTSVQLHPNPVTDQMVVRSSRPSNADLFDNCGRVVRSWRLVTGDNGVDLSDLSPGVYVLRTEDGAQQLVKD